MKMTLPRAALGRLARGDIDVIHANTEATLAVAASHRAGGGCRRGSHCQSIIFFLAQSRWTCMVLIMIL